MRIERTDFSDAPEMFHEVIAKVLETEEHRDDLGHAIPGEQALEAKLDGVRLSLAVTDGLIVDARYGGDCAPAESAVLETMCRLARGVPVRDFIEHGVSKVVGYFADAGDARPVAGILTARNAGTCFDRPRRLLKVMRSVEGIAGEDFDGTNFFDAPFSEHWRSMKVEQKRGQVSEGIAGFATRNGLDAAAITLFEIDEFDRVVVMLDDDMDPDGKPKLLMDLERWLRRRLGERIEVFLEIAKDSNRIRRL